MSQIRQNYSQLCEAEINKQINLELYASYTYQSMVGTIVSVTFLAILRTNKHYKEEGQSKHNISLQHFLICRYHINYVLLRCKCLSCFSLYDQLAFSLTKVSSTKFTALELHG